MNQKFGVVFGRNLYTLAGFGLKLAEINENFAQKRFFEEF
jgi:hypothetical protein